MADSSTNTDPAKKQADAYRMTGSGRLALTPAPNGGWVVAQESFSMGGPGETLGAYSDTKSLLEALALALPAWGG